MRIALAEPSQINRTIITRLLQAGGHEVRSFEDGPEALRGLAADAQLDAVITGSELKTMSGLELVWQARLLSGPRRFLYILFMSSLTDDQAVTEALDAGADDFIAKPPSSRELYARQVAVGEAIRRRFAASHLKTPDGRVSLTCSIGVAELVSGECVDGLFAKADSTL